MSNSYSHSDSVRRVVRRRAGGRCERCGDPFTAVPDGERRRGGCRSDATMHHRFKREYGGVDAVPNLVYVHRECHVRLHLDEPLAARYGLILTAKEYTWKPAMIRVDGVLGWFILTAEGTYSRVEPWLARELVRPLTTESRYRRREHGLGSRHAGDKEQDGGALAAASRVRWGAA